MIREQRICQPEELQKGEKTIYIQMGWTIVSKGVE